MVRLFTGIGLPEGVRDQIGDLHQPLPGVRWIDHDDLHVTLRFAGDIDKRTANEFALLIGEISHIGVFEMRLSGLGTFGGREPRLLWAGVEAGPELSRLARAHERAAQAAGLDVERRAFHPHVTIARLRSRRVEALARYLSRAGGFQTEPFLVSSVSLFSARPHTGGGPYVVEENFPLAGAWAAEDDVVDPDVA